VKVTKFTAHYRRTPKGDWANTVDGEILIGALGRSTLRGLWDLTSSTRMRADLQLSATDLSGLIGELSRTTRKSFEAFAAAAGPDPTVQQLLEAISS
jgi:hypothetical protein